MQFLKTLLFALTLTFVAQSGSAQSREPEVPPRAQAENHIAGPGSFRLNIQGYLGGAGRTAVFVAGEERENAGGMATTFGFQAQGLVPLGQYLLVGPSFSLRSLRGRGAAGRLSVYGFDLAFGAHYGIALSDSIAIDPYVLFTLGLSVADSDHNVLSEDTEFGVGLGIRAGATLWFDHAFGARFGVGHQSIHFRPESTPTHAYASGNSPSSSAFPSASERSRCGNFLPASGRTCRGLTGNPVRRASSSRRLCGHRHRPSHLCPLNRI